MNSTEENIDYLSNNEIIKKRSILGKALRLLKRPISIALLTTIFGDQTLWQKRFELKKDNPQRQVYSGKYEDYERYIKSNNINDPKIQHRITNRVTDDSFQDMKSRISTSFTLADKQREWIAGNVHSNEYGKRLIINEQLNFNDLDSRRKRVVEDINIEDPFNPLIGSESGAYIPRDNLSQERRGRVIVTNDLLSGRGKFTTIHEITHKITDGGYDISEYARKLFLELFDRSKDKTNRQEYIHNIEEIYPRIKLFQYELEKLGIWTYGEIFTKEHLKKALESNQLQKRSIEFLENINVDVLKKIMNTVAMNNQDNNPEVKEV